MKVTLHCEDVETHCAKNPKDAHLFRKEIDRKEIDLEYMPDVGETLSLFTKRGWTEFKIGIRGITYTTEDSGTHNPGITEYGLWAEKLTIMRHNDYEEEI